MTTLAAVNDTLLEVSNNTKETSKGISAFVKYIEKQKVKDLEAEREAKANQAKLDKAENQANRSSSNSKGGGFFSGLTPGKAGLIGAAAALGPKIASAVIRRLPGVALIGFADQIADTLLGPNFEQETKDTLARGLQGGGLGMLLGKRFILPFAALGALATDENKKMLGDIGKNLKTNWDASAKALAPFLGFLPSFDNILKFIGTGTTNGLKAIKGFTESGFNSEEFKSNWLSGVGLLGSVAAILMPGKFMRGIALLAGLATKGVGGKGKLGLLLAAIAGGTFVFDKYFGGDDGVDTTDVVGTTAIVGSAAYLANKARNRGVPTSQDQKNMSKSYAKPGSAVMSRRGNLMEAGKDGKATTVPFKGSQNKYPRLFGSKGFLSNIKGMAPLAMISAAFAGNEVLGILQSTDSEEVKKQKVGDILGPLMNETVVGLIGAGLGGMVAGPGGALVGGIAGGAFASLAPNIAGAKLAEFLMGRGTMSESQQNQIKSPNYIKRKISNLGGGFGSSEFQDVSSTVGLIPQDLKFKRNDYNQRIKNSMYNMSGIGDAGITNVSTGKVNSDNYSSSTVNNNQTALISGSAIDLQDQYGLT